MRAARSGLKRRRCEGVDGCSATDARVALGPKAFFNFLLVAVNAARRPYLKFPSRVNSDIRVAVSRAFVTATG